MSIEEATKRRYRVVNIYDVDYLIDENSVVVLLATRAPSVVDMEAVAKIFNERDAFIDQNAKLQQRVDDLERSFGKLSCSLCGGPHDFDTSIPSAVWNQVIRAKGLPEYLCTTCIVREFVRAGVGFTAELWNEEFHGALIEVVVNGQNAQDAARVSDENNGYRNQVESLQRQLEEEQGKNRTLIEVNAELIEGNHAAHVALDEAGIQRETVEWVGPIQHVTEYPVCDRIRFLDLRRTL